MLYDKITAKWQGTLPLLRASQRGWADSHSIVPSLHGTEYVKLEPMDQLDDPTPPSAWLSRDIVSFVSFEWTLRVVRIFCSSAVLVCGLSEALTGLYSYAKPEGAEARGLDGAADRSSL